MSGGTTTIHGQATDEVCLDRATFLIFDNYGRDPAQMEPESRRAMEEIDTYWDRRSTSHINVELSSGLFASLYTPKSGNCCPPTLALRGTQFPDARGIVFVVRMTAAPSLYPDLTASFDVALGADEFKQALARSEGFWETSQELGSMRVDPEDLMADGDWVEVFVTGGINTEGVTRIPLLLGPGGNALSIILTARVELWLNRDQGDWPANILQGLGQVPMQYEQDLARVAEEAGQIARDEFDGNLRITGHSLGGGLSSCAAIRLKSWHPDMNISAVTYDSSGLHERTATFHGTTLNMASAANILARSVEDEVLTSMQKRTDFLPVGSSLIRYSGPRMPPALGTYDERKGISQGIFGADSGDNPKIYAPKWGQMPNLLDLGSQDLVPDKPDGSPAFEYFENFAGLMAAAHDLQGFLANFHEEIDRRVLARRDDRARAEQAEEDAEAAAELAEAEAEAAAEAAEAQAEAAAEAAEAEAEAAAEAAEAESEANEGSGIGDFFYDVFIDEPGDFLSGAGHTATEVLDETGDLVVDAADEIGDAGSQVWDEGGDLVNSAGDAIGDLGNALYEYAFQYMEEYGRYGLGLFRERSAITALFTAFIDYHSDELAAFTFVFGPRR